MFWIHKSTFCCLQLCSGRQYRRADNFRPVSIVRSRNRDYGRRGSAALTTQHSSTKVGINFADKRGSLSRYIRSWIKVTELLLLLLLLLLSFTVSAWEWVYATNLSRLQREISKRHVTEAHTVLITAILLPQRLSCYWGKIVSLRMLTDFRLPTAQQRTNGQNMQSDL
jgi:hypothetical protein